MITNERKNQLYQALLASFRACLRCKPLSHPNHVSDLVSQLVEAVEVTPEKRWTSADFRAISVDESTARRQFKKRFNMTFVEYARSRRMGLAMKQIREGQSVIDAQLNAGYESSSGFRDAFSKIMGATPSQSSSHYNILKVAWLYTQLGSMIAISDDTSLYLLEFVDRRGLEREIECLRIKTNSAIVPGDSKPINDIQKELDSYFKGELTEFRTNIHLMGSEFQKAAWRALIDIPFGETRSYMVQAKIIGRPKAFRAVANANGANQLAIIVPCHRIINTNGELGGYGGGVTRKKWMIDHECNINEGSK